MRKVIKRQMKIKSGLKMSIMKKDASNPRKDVINASASFTTSMIPIVGI